MFIVVLPKKSVISSAAGKQLGFFAYITGVFYQKIYVNELL